ncbi:hypothetical protein D3C87_1299060 [compost metagenome]
MLFRKKFEYFTLFFIPFKIILDLKTSSCNSILSFTICSISITSSIAKSNSAILTCCSLGGKRNLYSDISFQLIYGLTDPLEFLTECSVKSSVIMIKGNSLLSIFFSFALITNVVFDVIPSKGAITTFRK